MNLCTVTDREGTREIPCIRPAHPGWRICLHHAWTLERDLGDAGALADELDLTLSRQTASGPRNGARSTTKPLPFDEGASRAKWRLKNTLVGWVRDLRPESRDLLLWGCDALARYLLVNLPRLQTHEAANEAVEEITDAVKECWRVIDRPAERVYAGQCLVTTETGETCETALFARPGRAWVRCRGCGIEHDVNERRAVMLDALHDQHLTVREIARLAAWLGAFPDTKRTEDRLNVWRSRGKLEPVGVDVNGRETYPFGETHARLVEAFVKAG